MDNLLERYVEFILGSYPSKATYQSDKKINVRCPVCGDSKNNRGSKRGYFLLDRTPYLYYCHNAGCDCCEGIPIRKFMKKYYPGFYDMYVKDLLKEKRASEQISLTTSAVSKAQIEKEKKESAKLEKQKIKKNQEEFKFFIPILEGVGDIFDEAKDYCINRKIPEKIWHKFFVCVNGKYENRLIIPFYDENDKIYFFQARALRGQEPKYLNQVGDKIPYNIFNVDKSKPIIALEGPIDSMFVENSIAIVGLKFEESFFEWCKKQDVHFILDNDKSGKQQSLKLIQKGLKVFNWKRFLKDKQYKNAKDVNDLVILNNLENLSYEKIKDYFTDSTRSKLFFV